MPENSHYKFEKSQKFILVAKELMFNLIECLYHSTANKQQGYSAVQHVALFLCNVIARMMAEELVHPFCWHKNALNWPEPNEHLRLN